MDQGRLISTKKLGSNLKMRRQWRTRSWSTTCSCTYSIAESSVTGHLENLKLRYSTEWSANIDRHRGYQLEFQLADMSVWCSRELLDSVKGKAFQRFRYSLMEINVWQFRRWALDPDRRGSLLEVSRGFSRCYAIWLSLEGYPTLWFQGNWLPAIYISLFKSLFG